MATRPKQQGQPSPPLPWDTNASIHLRRLRAREALRSQRLWATFPGDRNRDYEAFSIHQLADVVEQELAKVGVTCHFTVEKWSTNGYFRLVEGWTVLTCAERDGDEYNVADQLRVFSVGEGWDDSDKGFGKATSYARKSGMIQALNLAIGRDNEATTQRPPEQPDVQPQPMNGGAPIEGGIRIIMGGRPYDLRKEEVFSRVANFITTLQNVTAVEHFRDENAGAFGLFWQIDKQQAFVVKQTIDARIKALKEAAQQGAGK